MAEIIHFPNAETARKVGAIFDEMDNAIRRNVADAMEKMLSLGVPPDNIDTLVADVMQTLVDRNFPQRPK